MPEYKTLGAGVRKETYKAANERAETEGETVSSWIRALVLRELEQESANGDSREADEMR